MLPKVIIVNMTFPRFALCQILISQIVSDPVVRLIINPLTP